MRRLRTLGGRGLGLRAVDALLNKAPRRGVERVYTSHAQPAIAPASDRTHGMAALATAPGPLLAESWSSGMLVLALLLKLEAMALPTPQRTSKRGYPTQ